MNEISRPINKEDLTWTETILKKRLQRNLCLDRDLNLSPRIQWILKNFPDEKKCDIPITSYYRGRRVCTGLGCIWLEYCGNVDSLSQSQASGRLGVSWTSRSMLPCRDVSDGLPGTPLRLGHQVSPPPQSPQLSPLYNQLHICFPLKGKRERRHYQTLLTLQLNLY